MTNPRTLLELALPFIEDQCVGRVDGLTRKDVLAQMRALLASLDEPPVHADPTGTTREPPHCPTCSCWMLPEQRDLDPDSKRVLYGNLRELARDDGENGSKDRDPRNFVESPDEPTAPHSEAPSLVALHPETRKNLFQFVRDINLTGSTDWSLLRWEGDTPRLIATITENGELVAKAAELKVHKSWCARMACDCGAE